MSKVAAALLLLLVASNLAWWWSTRGAEIPTPPPDTVGRASEAGHIAVLEAEIRRLRSQLAAEAAREPVEQPSATSEARSNEGPRHPRAAPQAQVDRAAEWVTAALQTTDPAARAAALADIRAALQGTDPRMIEAALRAIARLRELDYDKESMRRLAQPMLAHEDATVRAAALYAVLNTVRYPGDRDLLLPLARDPSPAVRARMSHVLAMACDGKLTGAAAEAVAALLDDTDPDVRSGALNGLWAAEVDAEIERRCLALAQDARQRHDAIYFGLSTFANKSPAVVEALVEALTDPSYEISNRANWGLGHGVPETSHAVVADAYARLLETRSDARTIDECLDRLAAYGDYRHVGVLQRYASRPLLDDPTRDRLTKLIEDLAARPR